MRCGRFGKVVQHKFVFYEGNLVGGFEKMEEY